MAIRNLTTEELSARGKEMAETYEQIREAQARKKAANEAFARELRGLQDRFNELLDAVRTGKGEVDDQGNLFPIGA